MKMYIVYGERDYGSGYESPKYALFATHSEEVASKWVDKYTSIVDRMRDIYEDRNNPRKDGISKLCERSFDSVYYEEIEVR